MPHTLSRTDTAIAHEVLAAIIRQAELAAHLVHQFLTSLGVAATPERPTYLPRWLLMDLGSALQISVWERAGVTRHLPEALPPADTLLADLLQAAADPAAPAEREPDLALSTRVMAVHLKYFAYPQRSPLTAAVVLTRPDPDVLVEALAQFLWQTRATARRAGD